MSQDKDMQEDLGLLSALHSMTNKLSFRDMWRIIDYSMIHSIDILLTTAQNSKIRCKQLVR